MTQYAQNAQGEKTRFDEEQDRWVPVQSRKKAESKETSQPAPEGDTVVNEGNTTPRRARDDKDKK